MVSFFSYIDGNKIVKKKKKTVHQNFFDHNKVLYHIIIVMVFSSMFNIYYIYYIDVEHKTFKTDKKAKFKSMFLFAVAGRKK